MKRTALLITSAAPERVDEALRAALGLTLRGAAVEVWLPSERTLTLTGQRAIAVLRTFGHAVHVLAASPGAIADDLAGDAIAPALSTFDAVEVWT